MDKRYLMKSHQEFDSEEKMRTGETIIAIILLFFFTLLYSGCGGGGSHHGSNATPDGITSNIIEGVFVDSPIEGLNYQTDTHSGITDSKGRFICYDDEMITFMIGDLMLGQAPACELMSPLDFLEESAEPFGINHPMVTNMGRFLQSLDVDGDPDNGITITEQARNEISGRMIDFHQSTEKFENDPDVIACFDVFNALGMSHGGEMWALCPAAQAQEHMNTYMCRYGIDTTGSGSSENEGGDDDYQMMGRNMGPHM